MYTKTSSAQVVEWRVNQHCYEHLRPRHQGTEVLEMVYSPFNHLMRLLTQEYFTEFSHRESFTLRIIHKFYWTLVFRSQVQPLHNTQNIRTQKKNEIYNLKIFWQWHQS